MAKKIVRHDILSLTSHTNPNRLATPLLIEETASTGPMLIKAGADTLRAAAKCVSTIVH